MEKKITIPEVIHLFQEYYDKNRAWGNLHIVLDDYNVDNDSVEFCIKQSIENNDEDGEFLARIMLKMTKTQRLKISKKIK